MPLLGCQVQGSHLGRRGAGGEGRSWGPGERLGEGICGAWRIPDAFQVARGQRAFTCYPLISFGMREAQSVETRGVGCTATPGTVRQCGPTAL